MTTQSQQQRVRVIYPAENGRIVLRAEHDWDRNIEAQSVNSCTSEFAVETERPFFYFKPVLIGKGGAH